MGDDNHGHLALRQGADDLEHLSGQLRIQGGGGFIEAEDVRCQRQGTGDGHPLLLSAGELVGVVPHPVAEPHLRQQLLGLVLYLLVDLLLAAFVVRPLLGQQLAGQHHVLQSGILGKQVEGLEHHPKVEPPIPQFAVRELVLAGGVKDRLPVDGHGALVRLFQVGQAAQQGGLAAAGRTDDRHRLPLLQGEADVLQDAGGAEALTNVLHI